MQTHAPKSAKTQHRALFDCVALKEVMEHYSSGDKQLRPSGDKQLRPSGDIPENPSETWMDIAGVDESHRMRVYEVGTPKNS